MVLLIPGRVRPELRLATLPPTCSGRLPAPEPKPGLMHIEPRARAIDCGAVRCGLLPDCQCHRRPPVLS